MRKQLSQWLQVVLFVSVSACSGGDGQSPNTRRIGDENIPLDLNNFKAGQLTEGRPLLTGSCNSNSGQVTISGDVEATQNAACTSNTFSTQVKLKNAGEDRAFGKRRIQIAQASNTKSFEFTLSVCPRRTALNTYAVDENYKANDAGEYCMIPNVEVDATGPKFSFALEDIRSPLHLPDPSLFEIDGIFYVTGTGNKDGETGNIDIYRSTDLLHWEYHMSAFRPDSDGDDFKLTLSNRNPAGGHPGNKRSFRHLWDGTLSLQPNDANTVLLYFSAVENRAAGYADGWDPVSRQACCRPDVGFCPSTCVKADDSHYFQSLQVVSIPKKDFVNRSTGKYFADESLTGGSDQPYWAAYYEGSYGLDGGVMASTDTDLSYIPSTMSPEISSTQEIIRRDSSSLLWSIAHKRTKFIDAAIPNAATNLAMGGNIFKDPITGKHWLYYNWTYRGTNDAFRGNHVAMAPLETSGYLFSSATANTRPLPVAFKKNTRLTIAGVPEGQFALTGQWDAFDSGVAEGGNIIFNRNLNKYYTVYSRNTWNSPSYAMFYKKGNTLEEATLGDRAFNTPSDSKEKIFLASATRTKVDGPIYGGGELFEVKREGRYSYYVAFHARFATSSGYCAVVDLNHVCRTTFFKELTFDQNGDILMLDDSNQRGSVGDFRIFKMPRRIN